MDVLEKLTVLSAAAKYDVACTSSGVDRRGKKGEIGSSSAAGICHSFAADGRCISLLKVLLSNSCVYDCSYCVNRRSNETKRASFGARELAELTMQFYRRNYIEGLFLSSAVLRNPDYTCEMMINVLEILRAEFRFRGYIHVKAIPGADEALITRLGHLADRMSVNIELPSQKSLKLLAPDKSKDSILKPMKTIKNHILENRGDLVKYKGAPSFAPAGQSTQMIIGASPETDFQILTLSSALYKEYSLKRVFFSAYIPMLEGKNLPALNVKPPLLREHRLYQADWLMRFYKFEASELLDEKNPNFNPFVDPKCSWALSHLDNFPIEINTAPYESLLRIPGVGVTSAKKILIARRAGTLDFDGLKKLGIVLKRAQYFILCKGKSMEGVKFSHDSILRGLLSDTSMRMLEESGGRQLSIFDDMQPKKEDVLKCLTGQI